MAAGVLRVSEGSYKWWVLVTVVFGAFVSILDGTIVNTALPKIQQVFGSDLHEASYVATAYTLAAGITVPASGYLANRFGIKRIYLASLFFFTAGSALCGLAPSMILLIAFRVLQGIGGAALFPLSFALLFATFPVEERGRANGVFGIPVLVAPALGPTIGGYLSEYVDWRWIFYVNVPIGVLGVVLGYAVLREAPPRPGVRFDPGGFVLAAAGLGLLLYGLSNLAYDGWANVAAVSGPIVASLIFLAAFVPYELRRDQPLLDLRLYQRRNYIVGALISWLSTVGLFGPAFLLPQFLQTLRGQDPFGAGQLLFWQGVGAVVGTILSGQLYNRVGPRALIVVGGVIGIVTSYALASWSTLTSAITMLPFLLLPRGVGLPLVFQPTNTSALDGITGRALPGATTLNVVARNVVASLSIAGLANLVQNRTGVHLADLVRSAAGHAASLGGGAVGAPARRLILEARAEAFHDVFIATTLLSIPVLLLAPLLLPPGQGKPEGEPARRPDAPESATMGQARQA